MKKLQEKLNDDLYYRDDRGQVVMKPSLEINGQKIPDPSLHQKISFIKSAIRLGACAFGFFGLFELGFIGLFLAELVGIGEELV
jgi:hypothetical protein|tara:strand:- start:61 stop:312 length:252 start_codon:yes stop_codon:yes gene_type:complete